MLYVLEFETCWYFLMHKLLILNYVGNCDISLTGAFSHLTTGMSYLVKGNLVWKLKTDSRQPYALDYPPQKISQVFQDIPDTFDDAASYGKNYQTYVFKVSVLYLGFLELVPTVKTTKHMYSK